MDALLRRPKRVVIAVAWFSLSFSAARGASCPYDGPRRFRLGDRAAPEFVALADLDGDGAQDVVTANGGSNDVSVLLCPLGGGERPRGQLRPEVLEAPAGGLSGDLAAVRFRVENLADSPIPGVWSDAVYLSRDAALDRSDTGLATARHSGGLGPGQSYEADLAFPVPGVLPGSYHLILETDTSDAVGEGEAGEEDNTAASGPVAIDTRSLEAGTEASGTLSTERPSGWWKVEVPGGLTLDVALHAECEEAAIRLLVRRGAVPTLAAWSARSDEPLGPDAAAFVPRTAGGTYYVLARGFALPEGECPYTIAASLSGFRLLSMTPARAGRGALVSATVRGAGLSPEVQLHLIPEAKGPAIELPDLEVLSSEEARVRFVTPAEPPCPDPGVACPYDLLGERAGFEPEVVTGAFEVLPTALGPRLEARLVVPASYRAGREGVLWLEYANTGDSDMTAPLFVASSPSGAPMRLSRDEPFQEKPIHLLGINPEGDAGVLPAGVSNRIPIYFLGVSGGLEFRLGVLRGDDTPIDWALAEEGVRPPDAAAEVWDPMWQRLTGLIGITWADYLERLAADATRLSRRGERTSSVRELFNFEVAKALGHPTSAIGGRVSRSDDGRPVTGTEIVARTADGLGYGRAPVRAGSFLASELPPGTYELFLEGYTFPEAVLVELREGPTPSASSSSPIRFPSPRRSRQRRSPTPSRPSWRRRAVRSRWSGSVGEPSGTGASTGHPGVSRGSRASRGMGPGSPGGRASRAPDPLGGCSSGRPAAGTRGGSCSRWGRRPRAAGTCGPTRSGSPARTPGVLSRP